MDNSFPYCPHRIDDSYLSEAGSADKNKPCCNLASYLSGKEITTTPEICRGCCRTSQPKDINEVTRALAGITQSSSGVGTSLANTINFFISHDSCEACPNREYVMNAWGPDRCEKEINTILEWLRDSAQRNNVRYSEFVILAVVKSIMYYHKLFK